MKIALIISIISFIFSQANYQILSTPSNFKNIFEVEDFYDNYNYSVFNSLYPNDINLFAFTISAKKTQNSEIFITLKNLNYGEFNDNESNYSFGANESLVQFSLLKKEYIANKIMLNINYLKSKIDTYQSDLISVDLLTLFRFRSNHYFNIAFKNYGKIITSYSSTKIQLPKTINISYNFKKNEFPFSLITSYKKRLDVEENLIQVTLGIKLNSKLDLYISNRNNKSDLFFGEYVDRMMAGTNIGIIYSKNQNNLNLAFQNLGAAGYVTSFSFTKSIL